MQESTERKWERCHFLRCYRAHLTCNLQLKPPYQLGTGQAATQGGATEDREKQARNRYLRESLQKLLHPSSGPMWANERAR